MPRRAPAGRWVPKPEIFMWVWFENIVVRVLDRKSDNPDAAREAEKALVVEIFTVVDWPEIELAAGLTSPAPSFRAEVAAVIAYCLLVQFKLPQKRLGKKDWIELASRFTAAAEAVRQLDGTLARVPEWMEDHPRQTIAPLPEYFDICASVAQKQAASCPMARSGHPRLDAFTTFVITFAGALERATGRQITKGSLARAVDAIRPQLRQLAREVGAEFPQPNSSEACRKFVAGLFTEKTPAVVQEVLSALGRPGKK
jgi:hypothetical protein